MAKPKLDLSIVKSGNPLVKVKKIIIHEEMLELGRKVNKRLEKLEFNITATAEVRGDTLVMTSKPFILPQAIDVLSVTMLGWVKDKQIIMLHKHPPEGKILLGEEAGEISDFSDTDEIFTAQVGCTTILWDGNTIFKATNTFYNYDREDIEVRKDYELEEVEIICTKMTYPEGMELEKVLAVSPDGVFFNADSLLEVFGDSPIRIYDLEDIVIFVGEEESDGK